MGSGDRLPFTSHHQFITSGIITLEWPPKQHGSHMAIRLIAFSHHHLLCAERATWYIMIFVVGSQLHYTDWLAPLTRALHSWKLYPLTLQNIAGSLKTLDLFSALGFRCFPETRLATPWPLTVRTDDGDNVCFENVHGNICIRIHHIIGAQL